MIRLNLLIMRSKIWLQIFKGNQFPLIDFVIQFAQNNSFLVGQNMGNFFAEIDGAKKLREKTVDSNQTAEGRIFL